MTPPPSACQACQAQLNLALPKGRMYDGVARLLSDAGIDLSATSRGYRPRLSLDGFRAKILKPQAIVEMLQAGSRDAGFAGADWVAERGADVIELLDTGLDPVRLVVAAPAALLEGPGPGDAAEESGDHKPLLPRRSLTIASEYERLTRDWIARRNNDDNFVRSYGATEVLPPEDADAVVDVAASGATLEANNLVVVDEILHSSTRLYASRTAMSDPARRRGLEDLAMVLESVLAARRRVMLEVNVRRDLLKAVAAMLPCMREPTVSPLAGGEAFAVKAAVLRADLPAIIPAIRAQGGTDIVITPLSQVIP